MFYSTLLSLCAQRGIKITNVIKELNISSGNLSKWKAGAVPKSATVSKLADYFNVSADYLLGRTDKKEADPPSDGSAALLQEPYVKEITEALRRLTPESRKLVLAQIQAVGDLESSAKK